jgi:hypothetical protein
VDDEAPRPERLVRGQRLVDFALDLDEHVALAGARLDTGRLDAVRAAGEPHEQVGSLALRAVGLQRDEFRADQAELHDGDRSGEDLTVFRLRTDLERVGGAKRLLDLPQAAAVDDHVGDLARAEVDPDPPSRRRCLPGCPCTLCEPWRCQRFVSAFA